MNMKKQLAVLATAALLSTSGFASGGRGGGHVIDVDSTPMLMDLVTKAVCDWKEGKEFVDELPELRDALKKLAKLDWYYAADIEQEIKSLSFCMTGPLWTVPAYDARTIVRNLNERVRQAAYRLNENAYIDSDIYSAMPSESKAMLIIHETMHSYLEMGTPERSLRLRSMVKTINQIRKGEIGTRQKLHLAMDRNDIQFPLTVQGLDAARTAIEFLKLSLPEQKEMIKKTLRPETLASLPEDSIELLAPWDQEILGKGGSHAIFAEAFIALLQDSTPEEIDNIVERKLYKEFEPVMVALNGFYSLEASQKGAVIKSARFNNFISNGFDPFLVPQVKNEGFLIMASPVLKLLGQTDEAGEVPVLRLDPVKDFPKSMVWLPEMMIVLSENGELGRITKNEKFYNALGLKSQKEAVSKMTTKVEREKGYVVERLDIISDALVKLLLDYLSGRLDRQTFEKVKAEIKMDQF